MISLALKKAPGQSGAALAHFIKKIIAYI